MTIILTFDNCNAIPPSCIAKIIQGDKLPRNGGIWRIENEIRPSDLYCYLYAKFGEPNGIQNLLRQNDSDNLIHWEWVLAHSNGLIFIMGLNLRTEVHLIGDWEFGKYSKDQFINYIKTDINKYGKKMSDFRKNVLEHWDIFTNPYHDINTAIKQLVRDLNELKLNPEEESLANPSDFSEYDNFVEKWNALISRYHRGIGLALGIKSLTPVLAESFVNLLIYLLCKPDIKNNERLYQNFVRGNIDIKVQSLHNNCFSFKGPVDWSSEVCTKYNSIVNERNDLLHGNINIEKLKFQDIFFREKVPLFKEYSTIWQQSIGVSINSSGLQKIQDGIATIRSFENYVLSLLEDGVEDQVRTIMEKRDLGINRSNGRIGVLLPDILVDFGVSFISKK
jgi:hypothetical protein